MAAVVLLKVGVELISFKLTQPIRPGLSSQKYLRSKFPIRGLSSRPMKKSYSGFPTGSTEEPSCMDNTSSKVKGSLQPAGRSDLQVCYVMLCYVMLCYVTLSPGICTNKLAVYTSPLTFCLNTHDS